MAKVTIYTTPTCPWCKATKRLFEQNGVQYEEKDVAADLAARQEMVKKTGQLAVPVIDVEGSIVVGYDEPRLKELLKIGKK